MTAPVKEKTVMRGVALALASRGWAVFPLHTPRGGGCSCGRPGCEDTGKHPRTRNGLKDATTDPEAIARWWGMWPDANIGVRTGQESGIVVLDIDPRHGGDDALHELEQAHGALPRTVESLTGSGGRHIYFKHPDRAIPNSVGKLAPGLDVRADGGYVIAPPSVHANGRAYCWLADSGPSDIELAELPDWLARRLILPPNGRVHAPEDWRALGAPLKVNAMSARPSSSVTCSRVASIRSWCWSCCWRGTSSATGRRWVAMSSPAR
jgi:hypothetical protein